MLFARGDSRAGIWLTGLCVLSYWAVFLWASGRGYDFSDEAFHLITISNPLSYGIGDTEFGQIWHPLYVVLNGSIAGLRVAAFAILTACGALFTVAILRFTDGGIKLNAASITIVLGIAATVGWQYPAWRATANYNILNLSALLLFFAGLFDAARLGSRSQSPAICVSSAMWRALLCALGIDLMVLTKATTPVVAVPLGIALVFLLRLRRPFYFIALTAGVTTFLLVMWMIVIDGGIVAFIDTKIHALSYLRTSDGDVNGVAASVSAALSKRWTDVWQAGSFAAVLLALGLIWSCLLVPPWNKRAELQWMSYVIAALIGFLILSWRDQDLQVAQSFRGFRLWRLPLLFVLLAFALRIFWLTKFRIDRERARILSAAAVLAIVPVGYAVGSNALLIWKVAEAGIFWAAAMTLLASLAPFAAREHLLPAIGFFCSATSLGLLIGTMQLPGRIGAPVWEQSVAVTLGPQTSRVAVNSVAADYIESFQRDARANGFAVGMPILDLSEFGPGLTFALGAKPVGVMSWLIGYGDAPDEAQRRAIIASEMPAARRELANVPIATLRRAWIITGAPAYAEIVRTVLTSRGINFPDGYHLVSRNSRSDLGWTQELWKPVN